MKLFCICAAVLLLTVSAAVYGGEGKKFGHNVISGYESIQQYGFVPGNTFMIVEAQCAEGKKVLGGGYTLLSGGGWEVVSLGPSPDGNGYYLEMWSQSPEPQEVLVTAICAYVSKKPK